MPALFSQFLLCPSDIWLPLSPTAQQRASPDVRPVRVIGRLAPGASTAQITTVLDAISVHSTPSSRASVIPLRIAALGGADQTLWILLGAATLAFIVAFWWRSWPRPVRPGAQRRRIRSCCSMPNDGPTRYHAAYEERSRRV